MRVELLGCHVDALDMDDTVSRCREAIERNEGMQHVCVNAAKLVQLCADPALARIVAGCGLVSADGQAVVWAARILGRRLPERVAGIDLMERLLALAEREEYSVFVLGARDEVLNTALARLRLRYPALRIVGSRNGYFTDADNDEVCAEIRAAEPQILFVAISSPKKEYWLAENLSSLGVPFAMGVGGAIDVVAGVTARAPGWMQRAGLEWLFRFVQEPRRLASRYLRTNTRFVWLVAKEAARTRRGSPQTLGAAE